MPFRSHLYGSGVSVCAEDCILLVDVDGVEVGGYLDVIMSLSIGRFDERPATEADVEARNLLRASKAPVPSVRPR